MLPITPMKTTAELMRRCTLCPRECGADRFKGRGFCGEGATVRIARAELHGWEEPCISGEGGSGTVFFTGCVLGCCFCQNYRISQQGLGFELTTRQLADTFLMLRDRGAENINLVTPTHFTPQIIEALDMVRDRLGIPVVFNCGGYEKPETLEMLRGYVDVFLPDMKYKSQSLSGELSKAPDYFERCMAALVKMQELTGPPLFDERGMLQKGTLVRHLVLPGGRHDSIELIRALRERFAPEDILISLMAQFTPVYKAEEHERLKRRVTTFEYSTVLDEVEAAGFEGFLQERTSAREDFIPEFYDHLYYHLPNT